MIFIPKIFPLRTCPIDNSLLLLVETNNSDGFHAHQCVIYTDFLNYTKKKQFLLKEKLLLGNVLYHRERI